MANADNICEECDNALGTEVHHKGDKHDHSLENLQLLCARCHGEITKVQATEARRNRWQES